MTNLKETHFKNAAARLKVTRESEAKSLIELSNATGICEASIRDLEFTLDLRDGVSLGNLWRLSTALDIKPSQLFLDGDELIHIQHTDLESISQLIASDISRRGITVSDFEKRIGYSIADVLKNPGNTWGWNLACLTAVCGELEIDVMQFLD